VLDMSALAGALYLAADWPLLKNKGARRPPLKRNWTVAYFDSPKESDDTQP